MAPDGGIGIMQSAPARGSGWPALVAEPCHTLTQGEGEEGSDGHPCRGDKVRDN